MDQQGSTSTRKTAGVTARLLVASLVGLFGCGPAGTLADPGAQWLSSRYQSFRAPSEGMLPTPLVGDHFFVDLAAFGEQPPQRGQVVVLELAHDGQSAFPADLRPNLARDRFVKRILAIPGDTVESQGSTLRINGSIVLEEQTGERITDRSGQVLTVFSQDLDGMLFDVVRDRSRSEIVIRPFTVPADRYFVVGDNRTNSSDSRRYGTVLGSDLVGPVTVIYLSDSMPTWRRVGP